AAAFPASTALPSPSSFSRDFPGKERTFYRAGAANAASVLGLRERPLCCPLSRSGWPVPAELPALAWLRRRAAVLPARPLRAERRLPLRRGLYRASAVAALSGTRQP